jgi:hypothetical protein
VTSEHILRATWVATAVLAVTAVLALVGPDALEVLYAAVGIAFFVAGCATFVWGYAIAVGRSRTEVLSVIGIFFLSGAAPRDVRVRLTGALVAQSAIVVIAAAIRPYTAVAFGVLAPMLGLGLMGLWGARYGTFPARDDERGRRPAV